MKVNQIHHISLLGKNARYLHIPRAGAPKVVFIMGALQEIDSVEFYNRGLSSTFDYYAIELPGQGATEALPPCYTCEFIADCLHDFVETVVGDNFHLVGCSYATSTALEYAKKYSSRILRMVLAGSMARMPEETWTDLFWGLSQPAHTMASQFLQMISDSRADIPRHELLVKAAVRAAVKYIKRFPNHFRNNTVRLMAYEPGDISTISVPCLAFTGEYDGFVSPARCQQMADQMANCTFAIIPKCDHLFHVEKPELTLTWVKDFLLEQGAHV